MIFWKEPVICLQYNLLFFASKYEYTINYRVTFDYSKKKKKIILDIANDS